MTVTETRAIDTTDDATAPVIEQGATAWVASGEHKQLGRSFALLGIAALVGACVVALIYQLPGQGDAPDAFTRTGSRLASLAAAHAFVVGIPALWIGLATYVMPLQIGGHRLAMPRLHQLALWLFLGGAVLVTVGFLADDTTLHGIGSNVAAIATEGEKATDATLLVIAGLAVVALGTLFAASNLFITVVNRRGPGVRLRHVPAFTWSTLSTSLVLALSTPVFISGLVLLYLDQRYGGTVFGSGRAGYRIWQHEVWLFGRPEALVFVGAGIGIYCEIAATALRRPLAMFSVARVAAGAAPLIALFAWAGATSILVSPFAPLASFGTVVIAVPAVLAVLTWLATLRGAKRQLIAGVFPLLAHMAAAFVLAVVMLGGLASDIEGPEADYFRNGQLVLFTFGLPLLALAAGYVYWTPKLRGRVLSTRAGGAIALVLLAGVVLFAVPGHIVGLGGDPGVTTLGIFGSALTALALAALVPSVAGRLGSSPGDPYEGHTLEWAAASPPIRHNFDAVPDVRSPSPLYDVRQRAQAETQTETATSS